MRYAAGLGEHLLSMVLVQSSDAALRLTKLLCRSNQQSDRDFEEELEDMHGDVKQVRT